MISKGKLSFIVGLAAVIWAVLLIAGGTTLPNDFFRPLSVVSGILMLLLILFDKWFWHCAWLHPWLIARPDIRGTWKGELKSNWIDPKTGQGIPAIEAYLVVRQTYSSASVRLVTAESSSEMLANAIVTDTDRRSKLVGAYRNTPRLLVRDRSPIHHGGVVLELEGAPVLRINGEYWTDRNTKGEMVFALRNPRLSMSFDSARLLKFKELHK